MNPVDVIEPAVIVGLEGIVSVGIVKGADGADDISVESVVDTYLVATETDGPVAEGGIFIMFVNALDAVVTVPVVCAALATFIQ